MLLPFVRKVVKRCPRGHVMDPTWRTCPTCTGRAVRATPARDIVDRTVIGAAPGADDHATRMVGAAAPERQETAVVLRLVATSGPLAGQSFPLLPGSVRLGKSPAAEPGATPLTLADPYLSRTHAAIEAGPGGAVLRDLGSTNGTFVNEARVERAVLADGDQIRVGNTVLRVDFVRRG